MESKLKKVAVYCRISSDDNDCIKMWNEWIERSIIEIKENSDFQFSGIYIDRRPMASGNENRPQFKKILKDAKKGCFDMIITKSIKDLGRSMLLVAKSVNRLEKCGVNVKFVEKAMETSNDHEIFKVLESISRQECENIQKYLKMDKQFKMDKKTVDILTGQ